MGSERLARTPERRAEGVSSQDDIVQRLGTLNDTEFALLMGRLDALDRNDPAYDTHRLMAVDDTLAEIEATRNSKTQPEGEI